MSSPFRLSFRLSAGPVPKTLAVLGAHPDGPDVWLQLSTTEEPAQPLRRNMVSGTIHAPAGKTWAPPMNATLSRRLTRNTSNLGAAGRTRTTVDRVRLGVRHQAGGA